MSLIGVSPSDIVKGIELAVRIKQTWFDKANRADSLYREFGEDISNLRTGLQGLKQAFETGCYLQSVQTAQYHNPRDESVDKDRRALVGNFEATLFECEKLLKENASMSRNGLSFVKNAVWHLSVMPNVVNLRDRIKFHMIKMEFVMEPLRNGLMKDISMSVDIIMANMADIHAHLIQGTPVTQLRCPPIPPSLNARFEDALSQNSPRALSGEQDRSVELLFDVLHRSFLQSTFAYHGPASGVQTVQQYLNLLKAQFLLEKLQADHWLNSRYYYARSARLLELKIRVEFRRKDIKIYPETELEGLGADLYQIWDSYEQLYPATNSGENDIGVPLEEILLLHLVPEDRQRPRDLIVFRQSDHDFRLVRRTIVGPNSEAFNDRDSVNTHHYRYIPWYGIPTNTVSTTRVEIRNSASMDSLFYTFRDDADVLKFQHAILGYHVICDRTSLEWKSHSPGLESTNKLQNRVQLWRPNRRNARKQEQDSAKSGSDKTSPTSGTPSTSMVATTVQSHDDPQIEKLQRSSTIASSILSESESRGTERVTVIKSLVSPVLFIFTLLEDKYTFIHVELTPQHRLSYQSCKCDKGSSHTCSSVAVKFGESNAKFPFRIYSVKQHHVAEWDLALFANPQHPNFTKLKMRETIYLNLRFSSKEDRIDFARWFNKLVKDHRDKIIALDRYNNVRRHESDRPDSNKGLNDQSSIRSASFSSTTTGISTLRFRNSTSPAPKLDPIPSIPALSLPYRDK